MNKLCKQTADSKEGGKQFSKKENNKQRDISSIFSKY